MHENSLRAMEAKYIDQINRLEADLQKNQIKSGELLLSL